MRSFRFLVFIGLFGFLLAVPARAAVYQWSTTIDDVISRESNHHPRAFLWIPDHCQRVRAVVIAIQNMEEEQLFNDAAFRKTLSDLGFAIVWIVPPMGSNDFRFDQGEDKTLQHTLDKLGEDSGYKEIATAPLVPLGHSASASWCWDVAAWNPQRTLAVVSISGQWPYFTQQNWGGRSVDGVPGLTTKGEYEIEGNLEQGWYAGLKGDLYTKHPNAAFTQVVEPGGGHFAASDAKIALIDLFLRKTAQYRLPDTSAVTGYGPVTLKPIDAGAMGWRYDVWHLNRPPSAPAAPIGQYKGKFDQSFWAFDEEMAHAIEKFQGTQRNKTNVLIGYRQTNGFTLPAPDHVEVHLKFEPIDDGMTFKLHGESLDTVPPTKDGKPADWQKLAGNYTHVVEQGQPIPHPVNEDGTITIAPICGPVEQLSKDTFTIRFNRIGFDNPKRCNSIVFIMTYPGDSKFKRMVQQAELRFPLTNTAGKPQTIEFPAIPDVNADAGQKQIQLKGKSSLGEKVYYYVREGPAEISDDGLLTFTPIPPRAKFPVKVTVVAWQWGRSGSNGIQSAKPMTNQFSINGPHSH